MVYSSNAYLTLDEKTVNAQYIANLLLAQNWSVNSIAGVLGNMDSESTINPGLWESLDYGNMRGGYGLVQWTPANNIIDWANQNSLDYTTIDTQISRLLYEKTNSLEFYSTSSYPYTWDTFISSTDSPDNLASAWMYDYERPHMPTAHESDRRSNALYWYNNLNWSGASNPPSSNINKKTIQLLLSDALNGWKW